MRSVLLASIFALLAASADAATIAVKDAWIRTPPSGAPTAAGYVTITNRGPTTDRLTGARTAAAASADLHQMSMAGGIMRMRSLPGGLAIAASGTMKLSPSGDHLMLVGLKAPLKAGAHVKITLQFQRAGAVVADFVVRDAAPSGLTGMHE